MPRPCCLLLLVLLPACKKDEPAPPPTSAKIAVEQSHAGEVPSPPKDEPPPSKKAEKKTEYKTLDLRNEGVFALIDAPAGTTIAEGVGQPLLLLADPAGVQIATGAIDLAKIKQEWMRSPEFALRSILVEEADALLAEVEAGGKMRFQFRTNVSLGGRPHHVREFFNHEKIDRGGALQAFAWARTLRQTPELKKAQEADDAARAELQRLGAKFSSPTSVEFANISQVGENVFESLLAIPALSKVSFDHCGTFAPGLATLVGLPKLKELVIAGGGLNDRLVLAAAALGGLEALALTDATLGDLSLKPLENLTKLKSLNLARTRVADNGLRRLLPLKELRGLDLTGADVAGPGLVHLKDCKNLERLNLADTAIGDAGAKLLLGLPSLADIDLSETIITDAALEPLSGLPKLNKLNLFGTNVSREVVAKLRKARPIAINFETERPGQQHEAEAVPVTPPPPVPLEKLPPADVAALVARLGGKLTRDDEADGKPIIGVDLRHSKVSDADLGQLRDATSLRTLNLDGCAGVSDAGLPYLAALTSLEELHLRRTKVKGDGLSHLGKLARFARLYLSPDLSLSAAQLKVLSAFPSLEVLGFTVTEPAHPKLQMLAGMTKLKELNLGGVTLTNRKMDYLKALTNLEVLSLGRDGTLSDRGLIPLKGMTELKFLVVPSYLGSDNGLAHLRALTNLKTLELYGPFISDRGMQHVAALDRLERLRLDRLAIGDVGLGSFRNLEKLVEIGLGQTGVTDKGLASLAEIKELEFADLSYTHVTDAGLAKLKQMEELRSLRLEGTSVRGTCFKEFAKLPRLYHLQLRSTKIDDASLAAIAQLSHLWTLDLGKTAVSNAGIAKLKGLRFLKEINITDCPQITDEVAPILKEFFGLKRVDARRTKLSRATADELKKADILVEISP